MARRKEKPIIEDKLEAGERWHVAIAPYYWGKGPTIAVALVQLKLAGYRAKTNIVVFRLPEGASKVHVNDWGHVCWEGPDAELEMVYRRITGKPRIG